MQADKIAFCQEPLEGDLFGTHQRGLFAGQEWIEKHAPERLTLANGRTPKVAYEAGAPPHIAVRIQELYDVNATPRIALGRVPRALTRRLILEVDCYFDKATDQVVEQAFYTKPEERDAKKLDAGREAVVAEYALFTKAMRGDYLAGQLSAADYAFYPLVAFMKRCETKMPELGSDAWLTPELRLWKKRIEALPYFDKTIPPHWKAS